MKAGLDPRLRAPPIVCASPVSGAKRCPGTSSCGLPPSAGASCSQRWARGARQRACFLVGCPMALAFRWAEPAALRPRRRQARAAAPLGRISHALVALRRSGGRPARHAALARPPAQHAERAAARPLCDAPLVQRRVRRCHLCHQVPALGCLRAVLRAAARQRPEQKRNTIWPRACATGKRTASSHCTTTSFTAPTTASSSFGAAQPCCAKQFCVRTSSGERCAHARAS